MNGYDKMYLQSNLFADLIAQQRIKGEARVERDFYCPAADFTQSNTHRHFHQIIIINFIVIMTIIISPTLVLSRRLNSTKY